MLEALLLPIVLMLALVMVGMIFIPPKRLRDYSAEDVAHHDRLRHAGALLLLVGVVAGACVHWNLQTAPEDTSDITGYEIGTGYSAPIRMAHTKREERQLEQLGGKGAVLTEDVARWTRTTWQRGGKLPVAVLLLCTGGVVIVCCLLARF